MESHTWVPVVACDPISETRSLRNKYPEHYPALDMDPVFYIIKSNDAFDRVFGSQEGQPHLFEVLFELPGLLRLFQVEPDTKGLDIMLRAVAYFEAYTRSLRARNHPLHAYYRDTIERISRGNSRFSAVLTNAVKSPRRDLSNETMCSAGPVTLLRRASGEAAPELTLQLEVIVKRPLRGSRMEPGKPFYQLALVPVRPADEAALIFGQLPEHPGDTSSTDLAQLRWGLAAAQTAVRGIALAGQDPKWRMRAEFAEAWKGAPEEIAATHADLANVLNRQIDDAVVEWGIQSSNQFAWKFDASAIQRDNRAVLSVLRDFAHTRPYLSETLVPWTESVGVETTTKWRRLDEDAVGIAQEFAEQLTAPGLATTLSHLLRELAESADVYAVVVAIVAPPHGREVLNLAVIMSDDEERANPSAIDHVSGSYSRFKKAAHIHKQSFAVHLGIACMSAAELERAASELQALRMADPAFAGSHDRLLAFVVGLNRYLDIGAVVVPKR